MQDSPFAALDISASALTAQRTRVAIITQNIANASILPASADEEPYRRKTVLFESVLGQALSRGRGGVPGAGVRVSGIVDDLRPFPRMQRDAHPAADDQGWVRMPNVDLPLEMVDLMDASRAYESNLAAMRVFRQMMQQTLQITR